MNLTMVRRAAMLFLAVAVLAGCSSPMPRYIGNDPAMAYVPVARAGITDARPAFRSVFCQVLTATPAKSQHACDFWLLRQTDEGRALPQTTLSHDSRQRFSLLVVSGIFAECLPAVSAFADASTRLQQLGYTLEQVPVRGRASAEWNADILHAFVQHALNQDPNRKFIVLAYSKGAVDTLVALDRHPELGSAIAAVISFAGAINGSPLADHYQPLYQQIASNLPLESCPVTDGGELSSLKRENRLNWLATHPLAAAPRYFSIVATPRSDRVSSIFQPTYTALSHVDPRNDGQVLHYDAILPGATLLGYVNADHFAIALPFQQRMPRLAATFIDMNDFPRQQLVEAAVLFVEQALASQANTTPK